MGIYDFNTLLAIAVALACVRNIARMNGTTPHPIRAGILLILVGCLGHALGAALDRWEYWLDTLVLAGLLIWLLFNKRTRRDDGRPTTDNRPRLAPELRGTYTPTRRA